VKNAVFLFALSAQEFDKEIWKPGWVMECAVIFGYDLPYDKPIKKFPLFPMK
jgi:hypothetical protein